MSMYNPVIVEAIKSGKTVYIENHLYVVGGGNHVLAKFCKLYMEHFEDPSFKAMFSAMSPSQKFEKGVWRTVSYAIKSRESDSISFNSEDLLYIEEVQEC